MNRRLRTDLPTVSSQLKPSVPDMVKIQEKEIAARRRIEKTILIIYIELRVWSCQETLCG